MYSTTKVKVAKFSFLNEKSYNKKVIDFNFGRHKDLVTLKSDIHLFRVDNLFTFELEVKVTPDVAQYHLLYVTYAPAKVEFATSNSLGGNAFTRKYII